MSSGVGLLAWIRRTFGQRAVVIDSIAAVALTAGALGSLVGLPSDRTVPLSVVSAVVCATAVAWRRAAPMPAALTALTAVIGYQDSSQDTQGAFISIAIVLTCYAVGRFEAARRWRIGLVAGYALVACTAIEVDSGFSVGSDLLAWIPLAVLPIVAGLLVARRERMVDRLREMQSRLSNEQEIDQARAIAEERTRVARELHDVVAHCVSVMVIQAGAARLLLAGDVSAARDALRVVASAGREALADLRRVVGVRRRRADAFEESPVSLAQMERLIERMRGGGSDVHLHVHGKPAALSPEVDLTAFRIVQEALTNARKHAPSARVQVTLTHRPEVIDVRVDDTGPATPVNRRDASGHGLVGMRERVALRGGEFEAHPRAAGGFLVHARLPTTPLASMRPRAEPSSPSPAAPRQSRMLTTTQVDALFSVVWLVALEVDVLLSSHRSGPLVLNVAAVAVMALVGVIRRRAPFVFLAVVGAGTIAMSAGLARPDRVSVIGIYTLFVCSYTIAAHRSRMSALVGLGALLAGVIVSTVLQHAPAGGAFGGGLMTCVVWLVGRVMRRQHELGAELENATARLAAERDSRALLALCAERAHIARDLHALVARLVTTMVIQAEAADDLIDTDPAAAAHAISTIEQTGREALAQMRQMLGVLRSNTDPAPLKPHLDVRPVEITPGVLLAVPS